MRLFSLALPALLAVGAAIPAIPTHQPPAPTTGIVASADGTIYFVDSFHRTVWRVAGGRITPFVTGRNGRSLQIDEDGNVFGTHQESRGNLILWRADPSGAVVETSRTKVPDQHGHTFVLDDGGEVIGWTGSGKRSGVRLWRASQYERHLIAGGEYGMRDGAGSDARFFPIGGMTRTSDGELYVTSGPTIRKVDANGGVSTIASGGRLLQNRLSLISRLLGDVQGHLTGIAVDDDGTIYVANSGRDAVVRICADGTATEIVSTDGTWTPTGVAVADGVVYVLEYGPGVRVRRVTPDGVTQVVAMVRPERDRTLANQPTPRSFRTLTS